LQRLQSVIEEQMVEASHSFTKPYAPDEKESSAGTSSHATSRIRREGRLTLKHIFESFLQSQNFFLYSFLRTLTLHFKF